MGDMDGDEVAITIDIALENGIFKIETDAAKDDGRLIAKGPKMVCYFVDWDEILVDCDGYVKKVGKFLAEEKSVIYRELSRLE